MADDNKTVDSRNEVEIDLEKYMALIEKLDEQEDVIKEMKEDAIKAKQGLEPPKRKFIDLFLDDNDINEKAIIGFISFFLMTVYHKMILLQQEKHLKSALITFVLSYLSY